jgi:hypothetical protein
MDHIDLSGWEAHDGKGVADCIKVTRGTLGMIERLVVEVPKERGLTVSDITIGGVPIEYGGQIAECITVKLIGVAHPQAKITNQPVSCDARCCSVAAVAMMLWHAYYEGKLKAPTIRIEFFVPRQSSALNIGPMVCV